MKKSCIAFLQDVPRSFHNYGQTSATPPAWQRVEQMSWTDFPLSRRPLTSRTSSPGWRQPLRSAAPPFTTRPARAAPCDPIPRGRTRPVLLRDAARMTQFTAVPFISESSQLEICIWGEWGLSQGVLPASYWPPGSHMWLLAAVLRPFLKSHPDYAEIKIFSLFHIFPRKPPLSPREGAYAPPPLFVQILEWWGDMGPLVKGRVSRELGISISLLSTFFWCDEPVYLKMFFFLGQSPVSNWETQQTDFFLFPDDL